MATAPRAHDTSAGTDVSTVYVSNPTTPRRQCMASRSRVRDAIDHHQIVPVCQPIYSVLDRRAVGVEVLARFPGPNPAPDGWFAEARSVGLGVELELAAIEAALTLLPHVPPRLPFSVNASPETIHDPRLTEMLRASNPSRLVVELTEHHAVADYDRLVDDIASLRALGVRIAIDDVGAGFSSFAHVIHLRPDFIKIDMSLVCGVHHDTSRQGVIRAIVAIARSLDASVTAEGVETTAEMDALIDLGITQMQGFLFARPGPTPLPAFPEHLVAIIAPIRRRLSEEEQHHIDRQRFGLAFEHSPIGIAIVGLDGHVLNANPSLESILERTRAQLESDSLAALMHPTDLVAFNERFDECLQGRRSHFRIEARYLLADDEPVPSDVSVALARNQAGQPLYFIAQIAPAVGLRPSG